jgi:RimJ/RimL family protein N-acetyltransferase
MPLEIPYSTVLTGERILLRPPIDDDVPAVYAAVCESAEQLRQWMAWCTPEYGREHSEAYIRSQPEAWREGREYSFLIFDRQTGAVLGTCGLNRMDWLNLLANLGYWVRSSAAGGGVASAATQLVLRFAFEQLGLQRIEIVAAVGNQASQRVAEKVGGQREARARNRCRTRGVQQDAFIYSLIPSDLK